MASQLHMSDSQHHLDELEPNKTDRETMATTAVIVAVIAALAIMLVWFASIYYGTVYKNTDTENTVTDNNSTAPANGTNGTNFNSAAPDMNQNTAPATTDTTTTR